MTNTQINWKRFLIRVFLFIMILFAALIPLVAAQKAYEQGFVFGLMCERIGQVGQGPDCTGIKTIEYKNFHD